MALLIKNAIIIVLILLFIGEKGHVNCVLPFPAPPGLHSVQKQVTSLPASHQLMSFHRPLP